MRKISNKGQALAELLTLAAATIAITLVIIFFALTASLFEANVDIAKSSASFADSAQATISALAVLESGNNIAVSDMLRLSENSSYKAAAESIIQQAFSRAYSKFSFKSGSGKYDLDLGSAESIIEIIVPDFAISKKVEVGIK